MAKISILAGTTSKLLDIFVQDSSSTVGSGLGSIAFNTSGLTAYYYREGAGSSTSITLATMTLGTWATGGFIVVDGTNMQGVYQLGIPNAAIAAGAKSVIVYLKGVTNMAPLVLEIELTGWDNQDAVHGGLSALPNVASGSGGAIPTTGTGANQISVSSGQVILQTGTGTGQLDFTSGVVKANTTQLAAQTVTAAAGVTFPTSVASPTNITAGTITTVTNLTNAPTAGDLTAAMKTSVTTACTASTPTAAAVTGAVGSVTGNVGGSVASVTTISANAIGATSVSVAGQNAAADGLLDRIMSAGVDSGGDNTTSRTVRQALRVLRNDVSIAAGVMTVTKEDDTTTSFTAAVTTTAGNPISEVNPT